MCLVSKAVNDTVTWTVVALSQLHQRVHCLLRSFCTICVGLLFHFFWYAKFGCKLLSLSQTKGRWSASDPNDCITVHILCCCLQIKHITEQLQGLSSSSYNAFFGYQTCHPCRIYVVFRPIYRILLLVFTALLVTWFLLSASLGHTCVLNSKRRWFLGYDLKKPSHIIVSKQVLVSRTLFPWAKPFWLQKRCSSLVQCSELNLYTCVSNYPDILGNWSL